MNDNKNGEKSFRKTNRNAMNIIQVGNVLCSIDIFREMFCCNLKACHGDCCVEGDAGAPLTQEEVGELEEALEVVEDELTPAAREVIRQQGVAYIDDQGELVTSIVNGRDCVFAVRDEKGTTLCAIDRAQRQHRLNILKPLSCALYPIRMKTFRIPSASKGDNDGANTRDNGETLYGLNYHRWNICSEAVEKGYRLSLPVYRFLKEPLIRAFGEQWYEDLEAAAAQLNNQK